MKAFEIDEQMAEEPNINDLLNTSDNEIIIIDKKNYELKLNNTLYILLIEITNKEQIIFTLKPQEDTSYKFYYKKYDYNSIVKKLKLSKEQYNDIKKILIFFKESKDNDLLSLEKINEEKISIVVKRNIDSRELKIHINLNEIPLQLDEIFTKIYNKIYDIKIK